MSSLPLRSILAGVLASTSLTSTLGVAPAAHAEDASLTEFAATEDTISLFSSEKDGARRPFSLKHTDVAADLAGGFASVVITQTFVNPYAVPLEALYRFPLPSDAAVDRIAVLVDGKLLESEIREREQAQREYEAARDEGRHASLTEELRPNLFQHSIANVMPQSEVHITLHYVAPLEREDGEYVFALPTVAGPRYVSSTSSTTHPRTADVNPNYAADDALDVGLSVEVHVAPGVELFAVTSPTHTLVVENTTPTEAWARVDDPDEVPNRTFELRYRTAGRAVQAGVVAHKSDGTGTFALTVEPELEVTETEVYPKEMIFVVDTSGSMMGDPLDKAKAAIHYTLAHMGPDDTFQIVNFADQSNALAPRPLSNTPQAVARGLSYLDALAGSGGTEMLAGIRAALTPPADPTRLRIVVFMTDGYIGSEDEVLGYVRTHIQGARLFSFGVGEEVNRYLLDRLALEGRGAVQYVRQADPVEDVVEKFYFRIAHPVLTDITVTWGNLDVTELTPHPIPDLFADQPLRIVGRYERGGTATAVIRGRTRAGQIELPIEVTLPEREEDHALLETVWARLRVNALIAESAYEVSEEVRQQVLELGLRYSILTPYTSFVAIERELIANPTPALMRRALAAVHLPAGMRPEGIFGEAHPPATLAPYAIKPGDPEVIVRAPRTAQRVVALLPWGENVECAWEESLDAWLGRFLVPREAQEGLYRVRIFVVAPDGSVDVMATAYRVDSTAPTFAIEIEALDATGTTAGQCLLVRATPHEEAALTASHGSVVTFRSDIKRLVVRLGPDLVVLPLEADPGRSTWVGSLCLPVDLTSGAWPLRAIATDMAGNVSEQEVELWVR